jgi:hypothetical protein
LCKNAAKVEGVGKQGGDALATLLRAKRKKHFELAELTTWSKKNVSLGVEKDNNEFKKENRRVMASGWKHGMEWE